MQPDVVRLRPMQRLAWCLATAGGLGTIPFAPGTWGTLPGVLLAGVVAWLPAWYFKALAMALLALVAVPFAAWGERWFGEKDPHPVVIDETIGFPLTACFVPFSLAWLAAAFVFNRAFDILKPPPARGLQRWSGGWGIVADDVVSSLYAGLLLTALHQFFGSWVIERLPVLLTMPLIGTE